MALPADLGGAAGGWGRGCILGTRTTRPHLDGDASGPDPGPPCLFTVMPASPGGPPGTRQQRLGGRGSEGLTTWVPVTAASQAPRLGL